MPRIAALSLLLLPVTLLAADYSGLIRQLVTGDATSSRQAATALESVPPDQLAPLIEKFQSFPPPDTLNGAIEIIHRINPQLIAPAFLTVPPRYDPKKPTPLIVLLHGGVSKPDFRDGRTKDWHVEPVVQVADREGWLVLCPMGRIGCLWWDKVGMENIEWLVREVKRRYNVDDDRVAMCGFSDGGSGAFHFAMLEQTDFSAFFPWSSGIFIGTQAGRMQVTPANMRNRPVFATNGGRDRLFPAALVEPIYAVAKQAGARLTVTIDDTASHSYDYMGPEWKKMPGRLNKFRRNSFGDKLYWETADVACGSVDWLTITKLRPAESRKEWHKSYNAAMRGSDGQPVDAFPTFGTSGAVEATHSGNRFEVKASRVASFSIDLNPRLVDFSKPVEVIVNGKRVFNAVVKLDSKLMLAEFLRDRDRKRLVWARIDLDA